MNSSLQPPTHVSLHPPTHPSIYPPIHSPTHPSVCPLTVHLSNYQSIHPSALRLPLPLPVSIHLPLFVPLPLSVSLFLFSISPSSPLFVRLADFSLSFLYVVPPRERFKVAALQCKCC